MSLERLVVESRSTAFCEQCGYSAVRLDASAYQSLRRVGAVAKQELPGSSEAIPRMPECRMSNDGLLYLPFYLGQNR